MRPSLTGLPRFQRYVDGGGGESHSNDCGAVDQENDSGRVRILGASPEAFKIPATDSVALPNEASFEVLDLKRIKNLNRTLVTSLEVAGSNRYSAAIFDHAP
jgi:hypothetical protein